MGIFEDRASYLGTDWTVGWRMVLVWTFGATQQLKLLDGSMQLVADKLISRIGKTIDWPSFHEPLQADGDKLESVEDRLRLY